MIRSYEKVVENVSDPEDDLNPSGKNQSTCSNDTAILSSSLLSDDGQTLPYDLSQSSVTFEDNSIAIDYSLVQGESTSTGSDTYESAASQNEIGLKGLMNINGYSGGILPGTSNVTITIDDNEHQRDLKSKHEELIENIKVYELEKQELDLGKQKLAVEWKKLTGEKVYINSRAMLLAEEIKKIEANINIIQKSHDDMSECCLKFEKIIRQNKMKLAETKARLDFVNCEDYTGNPAHMSTFEIGRNFASTFTESQWKRSAQSISNVAKSLSTDDCPKRICWKQPQSHYWTVEEEAQLKVYMDDNNLWKSFKTDGIEIADHLRRENIVAPHRSLTAIKARLYRIKNNS